MPDSYFQTTLLHAFAARLEKEAGVASAVASHLGRSGVRNAMQAGVGSGAGIGLGVGALAGGLSSGKETYDAARAQGVGRLGSIAHAVGGGLGGAARGAGKGMLAGAALGGAAGALAPKQVISGTRSLAGAENAVGSLSRFGQRQVHGFTGFKPGGSTKSIERIGLGAGPARGALAKATAGGDAKTIGRATEALAGAEKAQSMGLTSLPGLAKSVKNNGLLPTVATGVKQQWASSRPVEKALMVGLPAASVLNTARKSDKGTKTGKGESIGRSLGGTLGAVAAPLPFGAGAALSTGLQHAGGLVGKGVDKLRGHKSQVSQEATRPLASEPGDTGQHAVEHVYGTGFTGSE